MEDRKLVKIHSFRFNKEDNGGESLNLVTRQYQGEVPEQVLVLNSYCNRAEFHLIGATLAPSLLKELATELEQFQWELP